METDRMKAAIINYGLGNLRSVANALQAVGHEAIIATEPSMLDRAEKVILPGVGAFADGMRGLREGEWVERLERDVRQGGKPMLGLCLGMQLLATTGTEHGMHQGLGWIRGTADRLPASDGIRIPHIGWNDVRFTRPNALYDSAAESAAFYFVHSYVLRPENPAVVTGIATHGEDFAASVEMDNIYATQFHPEKSQKAGLVVLKRFMDLRL
jgi:imidazole glycerol-phosphate synthase subunit HisH